MGSKTNTSFSALSNIHGVIFGTLLPWLVILLSCLTISAGELALRAYWNLIESGQLKNRGYKQIEDETLEM